MNEENTNKRHKTATFTVEYDIFFPGDVVRPKEGEASYLERREYVVQSCKPYMAYESDEIIVFLEGHKHGVPAIDLELVKTVESTLFNLE